MGWFTWLILLVIVLALISQENDGKKSRAKNKTKGPAKPKKSAKDIADEVTTLAKFRGLERKLESIEEKLSNFEGGERAYENM